MGRGGDGGGGDGASNTNVVTTGVVTESMVTPSLLESVPPSRPLIVLAAVFAAAGVVVRMEASMLMLAELIVSAMSSVFRLNKLARAVRKAECAV